MSTNDVVSKIAKLLALAGDNPSRQEAESAAEKAAELMVRHNISMAQVAAEQAQDDVAKSVGAEDVTIEFDSAQSWRADLASVVARSMQGQVVYTPNYGTKVIRRVDDNPQSKRYGKLSNTNEPNPHFRMGKLHFFGPAGSVESMVALYHYLEFQFPGLANRAHKERVAEDKANYRKPVHGKTFSRSYYTGLVTGLNSIFSALNARIRAEANTGSALMVLTDAVQEKVAERFPHLSKKKGSGPSDYAAFGQGRRDAGSLDVGLPKVRGGDRRQIGS